MLDKSFGNLALLLRVLGNTSSLRILYEAGYGFRSGLSFAKKLHLTPRKYYRCLRRLQELGILECRVSLNANGKEHFYTLTPFGRSLRELIFNGLLPFMNDEGLKLDGITWYCGVGVVNNYDDLVKVVVGLVNEAKSQILLVTKYLDLSVSQSLMEAVFRGVELKSVTSATLNLPQFMKLIGSIIGSVRPSFRIMNLASRMDDYRVGNVPTSFMIVDRKILVWEVPTDEFEVAFVSRDLRLIERFEKHFWRLWKAASKFPVGV